MSEIDVLLILIERGKEGNLCSVVDVFYLGHCLIEGRLQGDILRMTLSVWKNVSGRL